MSLFHRDFYLVRKPLGKRCRECGFNRAPWLIIEDGLCKHCMQAHGTLAAPSLPQINPADLEPADWSLEGCPVPGVEGFPYTLKEAHQVARSFGGKVVPLAYLEAKKTQALGVYPHPGKMVPSGGTR